MTKVIHIKRRRKTPAELELERLSDKQLDELGITDFPAFTKGHIHGEQGLAPINYQHANYYLGYFQRLVHGKVLLQKEVINNA